MTQDVRRSSSHEAGGNRVAWVDTAKGVCIVLVVMMHSTLGVGEAMAARASCTTSSPLRGPSACPTFFSSRACSYRA
jgi:uncharacterized membrane protein YcfT